MKSLLCLLAFLWPVQFLFCQPLKQPAALNAGDLVPELFFSGGFNYPDSTFTLDDFSGKIVILDYWGTWCGSCLKTFPVIDSLQSALGDRIQFIMVYRPAVGKPDGTASFFFNWKKKQNLVFSPPLAAADAIVYRLFPHKFLPYYTVIGADRRLIGNAATKEELLVILEKNLPPG